MKSIQAIFAKNCQSRRVCAASWILWALTMVSQLPRLSFGLFFPADFSLQLQCRHSFGKIPVLDAGLCSMLDHKVFSDVFAFACILSGMV